MFKSIDIAASRIGLLLTASLWLTCGSSSMAQRVVFSATTTYTPSQSSTLTATSSSRQELASGGRISLNGRTLTAAWSQWQLDAANPKVRTGLSDAATQLLGMELLNTREAARQPVQWFSRPTANPLILSTRLTSTYRFLDITELAERMGWKLKADGDRLSVTTPAARAVAIRAEGDRLIVNLNRPTLWQIQRSPAPGEVPVPLTSPASTPSSLSGAWTMTIDAQADPALLQEGEISVPTTKVKVEATQNQTVLQLEVPAGLFPHVATLPNPDRLEINFQPEAMVERDIAWAPGLRWRQQFLNLGDSRFPVVWLEINPHAAGVMLKPIWSYPSTLVGTAPLLQTAQRWQAAAAINGGFFNRNEQLPLGAIRRDGQWVSSPILNRGAIAWNDAGQVKIGRLRLEETLVTSEGVHLPILALNSGYVQAGVARYTSEWGKYTPLIDGEIIVVVQNNQVTAELNGGSAASKIAFPIPANGYLLVARDDSTAARSLLSGTLVHMESATVPDDFSRYPQILGAGPLLLQSRQLVLDAKAEKFSDAFVQEKAIRSAIGIDEAGTLLIATIHNRLDGPGPSLTETAHLMQQLGCTDALNLDGGSSSSLYLGGQLLNRSPRTAARVHNGLGVFLP